MGFMNQIQNVLNEEMNISVTENGALGYRTTGHELLDLNFSVASLRRASEQELIRKFLKAYHENQRLALKWLFFAGDVREGLGERRLFRVIFLYLAQNHPDQAVRLLALIPEYTRWDHVVCLMGTPLEKAALQLIIRQLREDVEHMNANQPVSLLAKWMPSINTSGEMTRNRAKYLAQRLAMTQKEYRTMLTRLRSYMKVVEVSMSKGDWSAIDYEAVPSRANLIYGKAFLRNDEERRRNFLAALKKGEAGIHAGVLFPPDIVSAYTEGKNNWMRRLKPVDDTLEQLWKALPDMVQGAGNTLCVADGSGSMTRVVSPTGKVRCLDVANALAIYFSEHCTGEFKDCYITFSQHPQLVDLSRGRSLHDKIEIITQYNEVANTNIEAVFDLILFVAVKNGMTQKDIPQNILILSDMEFDAGVSIGRDRPTKRLFQMLQEKYRVHGYRLPRIVFWNIAGRTGTILLRENELGVALVSGFSVNVMKMVLSSRVDPYEALLDQLNEPRYDAIDEALCRYV